MSRVREESGFTLIELLVGATLMLVVLGGVLSALTGFEKTTRASGLRNEAQSQARSAMDLLSRNLRNGGAATVSAPTGIEVASSYDLVFQTVAATKPAGSANSANLRRERYCLDASNPDSAQLVLQTQTWTTATPPAVPSATQCPSASWGTARVVAENVVNRRSGQDRPVFVPDSATPAQVTRLAVQLYIDANRGGADVKAEALLRSAVGLRNANQAPVAAFTATARSNGHVMLNASTSSDPEGEPLSFAWYDGNTQLPLNSLTYDYDSPSGTRTLKLVVHDASGLSGTATKTVVVP